jgi:hypothetical protein
MAFWPILLLVAVNRKHCVATAIFGLVSPALAQDDQSVNVDYY